MESLMSGERLKRKAFLNKEGVKYAARNSKEKYVQMALRNGGYELHEWTAADRNDFFGELVLHYLDWANEQAETGRIDKIIKDD